MSLSGKVQEWNGIKETNTANNDKKCRNDWSQSYGFISCKIYDKRDDFDFEIVDFPYLDRYVPCRPSYGVYISQLIRFVRPSVMLFTSTLEINYLPLNF